MPWFKKQIFCSYLKSNRSYKQDVVFIFSECSEQIPHLYAVHIVLYYTFLLYQVSLVSLCFHHPAEDQCFIFFFPLQFLSDLLPVKQSDLHFISAAHDLLRYVPCSPQACSSSHSCQIWRELIGVPVTFRFTVQLHLLQNMSERAFVFVRRHFLLLWIHISAAHPEWPSGNVSVLFGDCSHIKSQRLHACLIIQVGRS